MKLSPELRPTAWDALVVMLVAALSLGLFFLQWRGGGQSEELTAVVSVDGTEVDRFSPAELLKGPRTYTGSGYTLEVACGIRGEASALDREKSSGEMGVCVAHSDCPTQDCVRTGTITRSGQSVVCLPARFILRLEGGETAPDGVDAVLG